jgi:hypothetical protein
MANIREERVMFNKGAAIDQGRFCVLTILYTRVWLRIPTFNFPMCLGLQLLFSSYKNSERDPETKMYLKKARFHHLSMDTILSLETIVHFDSHALHTFPYGNGAKSRFRDKQSASHCSHLPSLVFPVFPLCLTNINKLFAQTSHISLNVMSGKRSTDADNDGSDSKRPKMDEENNFPYG